MNVWFVQVFLLALTFYLLYAHGVIGRSGGAVAACFIVKFLLGSVVPAFLLRIAWKTQELRRLKAYYEGRMSRLEGDWPGRGDARDEFFTPDHPYSVDLNVFGEGSLLEYLCSAQTGAARECLVGWLLSPSSAEEIQATPDGYGHWAAGGTVLAFRVCVRASGLFISRVCPKQSGR